MQTPIVQTLIGIIASTGLLVSGWQFSQLQTVQAQVNTTQVGEATIVQKVDDIDTRTSKIESKLDTIIYQTKN